MTREESRMLREVHTQMGKLLYDLYEVPKGSPEDVRPLIQEIRIVVRAYQRSRWATRLVMWILPAVAGVGLAIEALSRWLRVLIP